MSAGITTTEASCVSEGQRKKQNTTQQKEQHVSARLSLFYVCVCVCVCVRFVVTTNGGCGRHPHRPVLDLFFPEVPSVPQPAGMSMPLRGVLLLACLVVFSQFCRIADLHEERDGSVSRRVHTRTQSLWSVGVRVFVCASFPTSTLRCVSGVPSLLPPLSPPLSCHVVSPGWHGRLDHRRPLPLPLASPLAFLISTFTCFASCAAVDGGFLFVFFLSCFPCSLLVLVGSSFSLVRVGRLRGEGGG